MNKEDLINTAKKLVRDNKGLLAMGESNPTSNKRLAAHPLDFWEARI